MRLVEGFLLRVGSRRAWMRGRIAYHVLLLITRR
jgi:hypothetical protein